MKHNKKVRYFKPKQSKHNQIKAHLESGRTITGAEAWHHYGLYRLSSVINRLRNKGMKINTRTIVNKYDYSFAEYYTEPLWTIF